MNAQVTLLYTFWLLLLPHVKLMLVVDEVDDWSPRVAIIHIISETGGIDNRKFDFKRFLLQFSLDDINLYTSIASEWRAPAWRLVDQTHTNLSEFV